MQEERYPEMTRSKKFLVFPSGLMALSLAAAMSSYFALDMSDAAMGNLQPNKDETNTKAKALFGSISELTRVTNDYVASMK